MTKEFAATGTGHAQISGTSPEQLGIVATSTAALEVAGGSFSYRPGIDPVKHIPILYNLGDMFLLRKKQRVGLWIGLSLTVLASNLPHLVVR